MNIEEGNPQGISEESNVPDIGTETAGTDPGAAEREEVQKAGRKSKDRIKAMTERLRERARRRKRLILRQIELKRLKRVRRKTVPAYTHCKNCGTELKGMYCHRCGQYALDVEQPFWKYITQYFENAYSFDNKIWITLWMLFRRPGFLTTEFNAGKIVSYVHPMKLLMFISLLFFLFFFIMVGKELDTLKVAMDNINDTSFTDIKALNNQKDIIFSTFLGEASKWTPILVLLLTPFMALLCRIFYHRRRISYMGNFVFVLHLTSLSFIVLTAFILLCTYLPDLGRIWSWLFVLYMLFYTTVASHRVYTGTGWVKSAVKSLLLWFIFLIVISIALLILTIIIAAGIDI